MKIGIIVAMTSELDCVRTLLQEAQKEVHNHAEFYFGRDGQHEIILQRLEECPVNTLLRRLIDKADVISYQKIIPGMNDIFIKLVKEKQ